MLKFVPRAIRAAWSALLDLISEPASPAYRAAMGRPPELKHILWPWLRYAQKRRPRPRK